MACECLLGQTGRFLTFFLLAGGCICGYLAAMSCEFVSLQSQRPELLPGVFVNRTEADVGIFSYQNDKGDCTLYQDNFMQAKDAGDFNAYFITAQFAAVIGPSCGAMAWLINLIEWLFWSNTCTYLMAVAMLICSFGMQGMTFMIYGQREFWYVFCFVWFGFVVVVSVPFSLGDMHAPNHNRFSWKMIAIPS